MPYEYGQIKHVHTDHRREIHEVNFADCSVQSSFIYDAIAPLGNHYHTRKTETFILVNGEGIVSLCDVGAGHDDPVTIDIRKGAVIRILPNTAHAFRLTMGSVLVGFSSEPFNPSDPDIHPFKLLS